MDFLVGGVPRSGTSICGNVFNFHPDGYCYAAETHWLPFLQDVAVQGPVPRGSIPRLREMFARQNRQVLVDMVRYSVERGGNARMLVFDEKDIGPLTDQAMALLERGMFGAELCAGAARILRQYIHGKTGKTHIGEKTPSNAFAFRDYGALGARAAFAMVREPFAVIRSMRKRAGDTADRYASPFRNDLLELVGMYILYMDAIRRARSHEHVHVIAYDDLLGDPRAGVARLFARAGLPEVNGAVDKAAKRVRLITPGNAWEQFSPAERSLVLHLTAPVRAGSPFDTEYFSRLGLGAGQLSDPLDGQVPDVVPMHGVNAQAPGEPGRWLMRDACLAVVHGRQARKLQLALGAEFPDSVLAGGATASLAARDHVSGEPVGTLEVPGGRKAGVVLDIDLARLTPVCAGNGRAISVVDLHSTHAFRSTTTPERRLGFTRFGRDHRLMSYRLTGFEFH